MGKVITYECDQCGCEVVVTETPETDLGTIYCCGAEVKEVARKSAKPKKKVQKKVVKKVAKKVVAKKPAKKTAKKK